MEGTSSGSNASPLADPDDFAISRSYWLRHWQILMTSSLADPNDNQLNQVIASIDRCLDHQRRYADTYVLSI
eukprot:1394366-Amorphochlora_amoeboformis.AAC.1